MTMPMRMTFGTRHLRVTHRTITMGLWGHQVVVCTKDMLASLTVDSHQAKVGLELTADVVVWAIYSKGID